MPRKLIERSLMKAEFAAPNIALNSNETALELYSLETIIPAEPWGQELLMLIGESTFASIVSRDIYENGDYTLMLINGARINETDFNALRATPAQLYERLGIRLIGTRQIFEITALKQFVFAAEDGAVFTTTVPREFRWGNIAGDLWSYLTLTGDVVASNATFGGDPAPGLPKIMQVREL